MLRLLVVAALVGVPAAWGSSSRRYTETAPPERMPVAPCSETDPTCRTKWKLEGDRLVLASPQVEVKGKLGIAKLKQRLFRSFPNGKDETFEETIFMQILQTLNLGDAAIIRRIQRHFTEFQTIGEFLTRIETCAGMNPIFLAAAYEYSQLSSQEKLEYSVFPEDGQGYDPSPDHTIRETIHYAYVLHILTREVLEEEWVKKSSGKETIVEMIYNRLMEKRKGSDWKKYTILFE